MENVCSNQASRIDFLKNKNLRVLLADDNRVNQFLGKRILQNIGISSVELASDGHEALALLQHTNFDVLLTDVEMPGMNGYELSDSVHRLKTGNSVPVIIALTANASEEDREMARSAGIHDYLTKPYSPQDLLEVLWNHFGKEELLVTGTVHSIANVHSITLHRVVEIFHNNADDIRHFLLMLSQQLPQLLDEIKKGIAEDNWNAAFQASHKLKSPVSLLGDSNLTESLTRLSENMRHRRELHACPAEFDQLLPQFESMMVLINSELEKQ